MLEEWTRWQPVQGLGPKYFIDSISDNLDGLQIILFEKRAKKERVIITFEDSVDGYIRMDETYRYKLILDLGEKYGLDFYGDWTFFKVTNSSFLKWISEQSCTISDHRHLIHFSILAGDSVLDIVSGLEPKVEIIKLP